MIKGGIQSIPPKRLKIAVSIIIAVMFILGVVQLVQGFIDTHNYSDQIVAAIEKQTKRKVTIKGTVSVALLPTPTLYIPGLELRDPNSDAPAPAITIDLVSIDVAVMSLFSDTLRISNISLDYPVIELISADDNLGYLEWVHSNLLKSGNADGTAVTVNIANGKMLYIDTKTEKAITIEKINSSVTISNQLNMKGSFHIDDRAIDFSMSTGNKDSKQPESFLLKMSTGNDNVLELKGAIDAADNVSKIKGTVALKLDNVIDWAKAIKPHEQQTLGQISVQVPKDKSGTSQFALDIAGDWSSHGVAVEMTNVILKGLASDGAGKIQLSWNDSKPNVVADMKFTTLSYDPWGQLIIASFANVGTEKIVYHEVNEVPDNPIPDKINIKLDLKTDELHYGTQVWKDAHVSSTIGSGIVTVNQFEAKLQGDSLIMVSGVVSPSATGNLRFEGSLDTNGKSLRKTLTLFDETAADLPETGFGDFFTHSNLFISAELLRLDAADVKLGDLHLTGGLVAYFDANPRIEADIKLKNIDFDYFRNAWRANQKKAGITDDFFLKFDKNMNFEWLKKLQTAIDFKISVEHFTFLDRNGDNASFRLYAKNGDLGVYDANFIYPSDITKAYFKLNVNGEQPSITLNLTTSELNTDYFNLERYAPAEITPALKDTPVSATPVATSEPATKVKTSAPAADINDIFEKFEISPQSETILLAANEEVVPPRPAAGVDDLVRTLDKNNTNIASENKKHWPEKLIDMSWLNGYSGNVEFNINKLIHRDIALGNLKVKASIGKDLIIFKMFNFSYWGGQCSILGSVYGGTVPGFSVSFTIVDAQVQPLFASFTNRQNINGQVSISAAVASSGINFLSWISQAEGKMVLIGRNIYVQGLNMQGVVDSVAISRTSSDVLNSVDHSIFNGFTIFSIDGNLNIKNGTIRTPGIGLRTASTIGNLTGELKMVPWTLELSSLFQFPSMSSETVPTMTIQYSGTPDTGQLKTDTSSLESFVAKRIISK